MSSKIESLVERAYVEGWMARGGFPSSAASKLVRRYAATSEARKEAGELAAEAERLIDALKEAQATRKEALAQMVEQLRAELAQVRAQDLPDDAQASEAVLIRALEGCWVACTGAVTTAAAGPDAEPGGIAYGVWNRVDDLRKHADALQARVEHLEECMRVAGLRAFMRDKDPAEVAEHLRVVAESWAGLEAENARLHAERYLERLDSDGGEE